jgi:hypothetical protein
VTLSGLPQAEVTENEEHHDYEANQVDEVVHVTFSFLARERITDTSAPIPFPRARPHERTGRAEAVHSCLRSPYSGQSPLITCEDECLSARA